MFEWWRGWRRRRSMVKSSNSNNRSAARAELREFVYLDDTSVYSLVASRLGPVTTEQTESRERKHEAKATGTAGDKIGPVKLGGSLEGLHARSTGTQVMKKSIVQATFKELLEAERTRLLLRCPTGLDKPTTELVSSELVKRGALIELDVELDVEPIYRMVTVASSLVGIVDKTPELFDEHTRMQFAKGRAMESILRGLLGGLVPIRARVLNRVVVSTGERFSIAPEGAAEAVTSTAEPLYLVGVAEEELFWKDIRRVLFSLGRYRVLARIAQDGIRDSWTPVKLGHVLEQIVPGFSNQLGAQDWSAFMSPGAREACVEAKPRGRQALLAFVELVGERIDSTSRAERVGETVSRVKERADETLELSAWRDQTNEIVEALLGQDASKLSAQERATLRTEAEKRSRKNGALIAASARPSSAAQAKHFLDCEFVAIYW